MARIDFARLGYSQDYIGQLILRDLEAQREHCIGKIAEFTQLIGNHAAKPTAKPRGADKRTNHMSAAGRAAVAAAQKRRWAKVKREKKAAAAKKLVRVKTFAKIKRAKPQEQPKTAA